MTVHQCPKCELKFAYKTEVDDHCWHDHPEFRHEYPAARPAPEPAPHELPHTQSTTPRHTHIGADSFSQWLRPTRPRSRPAEPESPPPPA